MDKFTTTEWIAGWAIVGAGLLFWLVVVVFLTGAIWHLFIWPAVEAISLTRCYRKVCRVREIKPMNGIRSFWAWYKMTVFGRDFTRISGQYYEWEGVGSWTVYDITNTD